MGLFLARISQGRTIRQLVVGTLLLPLAFMMAWMSITRDPTTNKRRA
nr:BCCT family transporter [Halomonas jincaotanensis]